MKLLAAIHPVPCSARRVLALVAALVLTAPSSAVAQVRASGVQITPDAKRVLISKDVGDERWALSLNDDDTVTGNVFRSDGSPPSFVWCEEIPGERTASELTLACYGAAPCPASPCTTDEWDFIADVTLPVEFFAPPSAPTTTPSPTATPSPTVTSSPATPSPGSTSTPATPSPATPSPFPTVTSSPDDDDDEIRCCVPDDGGTECEDRTPGECVQRGGTNLGPGSCDPNPCG